MSVSYHRNVVFLSWSPNDQRYGYCGEILIHLAPTLPGDGVRPFGQLGDPLRLEKVLATDGAVATHVRYPMLMAGVLRQIGSSNQNNLGQAGATS
jgi:hypothetical protein